MSSVLHACGHRSWAMLRKVMLRNIATAPSLTCRPSTICARVMLRLHMGHVECPLLHQDTIHSLQENQQKLSHRVCTVTAAQPARWLIASPQASRNLASRHAGNRQHSTQEASSCKTLVIKHGTLSAHLKQQKVRQKCEIQSVKEVAYKCAR